MIKIIVVLLSLSISICHSAENDTDIKTSYKPVKTSLLDLYQKYGYQKPIPQETKNILRLNLSHRLRSIVQNEESYHSYALFLLGQLNEGDSDYIVDKSFFNPDWQKQFDALKTVFFFGYPNDLTPLIISEIKKNHWLGGIRIVSENVIETLSKNKLSFSEKVLKWDDIENQFYKYLESCKIDNRINKGRVLQKINQIEDERLVKLLTKNNVPINKLDNIYLNLGEYKLLSALSNQLVIVNSKYELTILNTGSLKPKYFIEQNNKIFVVLNGYDSIGHDKLFLLQYEKEKYILDYLFTFIYLIEDIKQNGNITTFQGSNWSMSFDSLKLTISPMKICNEYTDFKIGL